MKRDDDKILKVTFPFIELLCENGDAFIVMQMCDENYLIIMFVPFLPIS